MSSNSVISVRGIGKTFRIASTQHRATTLAELVAQKLHKPFTRRQRETTFDALDDISFEGPDMKKKNIRIDAAYVQKMLADIVKDQDLSRYIL